MGQAVRGKQIVPEGGRRSSTASIDGIGTLTVPVVAGAKPPDGTGVVPAAGEQLPQAAAVVVAARLSWSAASPGS